jgi:hypothetical protein
MRISSSDRSGWGSFELCACETRSPSSRSRMREHNSVIFSCSSWVDASTNLYVELGLYMLQTLSATYRLPCPVVREPEDDREPEMVSSKSKSICIYTIWTNGPTASLDARAARDPSIAAKLQSEHKKVKEEGWKREVMKGTFCIQHMKVGWHHASASWVALALETDHVSWEMGKT